MIVGELWRDAEKRRSVGQSCAPGASVSEVTRRYDVNVSLLFAGRRDPRTRRRPMCLFSGLLRGDQCDDSYCMLSGANDGCTNWKTRGTCHIGFTIKRTEMEKPTSPASRTN